MWLFADEQSINFHFVSVSGLYLEREYWKWRADVWSRRASNMRQRQQKPLASSICKQHPYHRDYLNHHQHQHNYNHNHHRDHHIIKGTRDNLLSDADNNLEQLSIADSLLVLGLSPREKFHSRGKMNQRGDQWICQRVQEKWAKC